MLFGREPDKMTRHGIEDYLELSDCEFITTQHLPKPADYYSSQFHFSPDGDLRGMSNMAELQDFRDFQGFFDTVSELHVLVMFSLVFS